MIPRRERLGRIVGFGLVTVGFSVTQPVVLIGLPLALLLITYGPHNVRAGLFVGVAIVASLVGDRMGLWWFERGWALMLAGSFVWVTAWRPGWSFTPRALWAIGFAVLAAGVVFLVDPAAWRNVDALMDARAGEAAQLATRLVGGRASETVRELMGRVISLQVAVFPALLGVSSLGALGLAVALRGWLGGGDACFFAKLRSFRFNDHLVWIWLGGLLLILAPIGEMGHRLGSNAVLFMGVLYIFRGVAVVLSVTGGISLTAGIVGGLVALVVYPILALLLAAMLVLGVGDTWLNVRGRIARRGDRGPADG